MGRGIPFGCGQCLPCRINRRRQWMWRQYLESLCHDENCFVTLTYNEKNLPADRSLEPDVVSRWLRAVRDEIRPHKIRYMLVGEYGEETFRPHYHLSVFGVSRSSLLQCGAAVRTFENVADGCWGKGFISVGEFNEKTAQYVAGYVVKKYTDHRDGRLMGRVPEFARMSRRPGLGSGAMSIVADAVRGHYECYGDIPSQLRVGKRAIPLGRFLRKRLFEYLGVSPEQIEQYKQKTVMEQSLELRDLLLAALETSPLATTRSVYLESAKGRIAQTEARAAIWRKRNQL